MIVTKVLPTYPTARVRIEDPRSASQSIRTYADDASGPCLDRIVHGRILAPNINVLKEVSFRHVERLTSGQELRENLLSEGLAPATPDVMISLIRFLSGSKDGRPQVRRKFMENARTILCLETTPVAGTGPTHLMFSQDQCEMKAGQRPWSIRTEVGMIRIPSLYSILVMDKAA